METVSGVYDAGAFLAADLSASSSCELSQRWRDIVQIAEQTAPVFICAFYRHTGDT